MREAFQCEGFYCQSHATRKKKQIEKCMKRKMEKRIFHNLEIIWFQLFSKHKDIQISPSTKETQF